MSAAPAPVASRAARAALVAGGLVALGFGGLGVVVPGLPTTVFLIVAAWCFSRSSPRLERWVLDLPRVGALVRDYRAGLGMPRRAKVIAVSMLVLAVTVSVVVADGALLRLAVALAGVVGAAYITWRVPTRERVLATRA